MKGFNGRSFHYISFIRKFTLAGIHFTLKMPTFCQQCCPRQNLEAFRFDSVKSSYKKICMAKSLLNQIYFLLNKRKVRIHHSFQSKLLQLRRTSFHLRWLRPPMTSKESSWGSLGTYLQPLMYGKSKIAILQGLVTLY